MTEHHKRYNKGREPYKGKIKNGDIRLIKGKELEVGRCGQYAVGDDIQEKAQADEVPEKHYAVTRPVLLNAEIPDERSGKTGEYVEVPSFKGHELRDSAIEEKP